MKQEQVNQERMKEMEVQMGCRFCEDGEFAEMSLTLEKYEEKTEPIASVTFGFYHGDVQELKKPLLTKTGCSILMRRVRFSAHTWEIGSHPFVWWKKTLDVCWLFREAGWEALAV